MFNDKKERKLRKFVVVNLNNEIENEFCYRVMKNDIETKKVKQ